MQKMFINDFGSLHFSIVQDEKLLSSKVAILSCYWCR